MAGVFVAQGKTTRASASLALFLLGVAYVLAFSPWRYPETQVRVLYLGVLAVLLAGDAVVAWQYGDPDVFTPRSLLPLVSLPVMLVPFLTLGRKTWADLHEGSGSA